jgi:hypothetical protein
LETSLPGVFVAGDCRSKTAKRVAFAVGDGALAVNCVQDFLELNAGSCRLRTEPTKVFIGDGIARFARLLINRRFVNGSFLDLDSSRLLA